MGYPRMAIFGTLWENGMRWIAKGFKWLLPKKISKNFFEKDIKKIGSSKEKDTVFAFSKDPNYETKEAEYIWNINSSHWEMDIMGDQNENNENSL